MNSKVIKFVAGGGKTTESINYLDENRNGLYLAFTNSVVSDVSNKGYLSKTIDSLFVSFIIPKLSSIVSLIASGSQIKYSQTETLPLYLKGSSNIRICIDGTISNQNKKTIITMNTSNSELHSMKNFPNENFVKYIFGKTSLYINDLQRDDIASYLIHQFPNEILEILESRFSYIIIDEAQDLKSYREEFAKLLYSSNINIVLLGDDNQNINGGGKWFEELHPDEIRIQSHRCPDGICTWIRENLNIEIYGNSEPGCYTKINFNSVLDYDDGKRVLLYMSKSGKAKGVINNWSGPKDTIRSAKGKTIYEDIVIVGQSLNNKNLYTAITRTKRSVYSTIQ